MPGTTKLDYEQMQQIAKQFQTDQNDINNLLNQTKSKVEALHNNQWIGQAADAFFNEMENTMLPKLSHLVNALEHTSQVTAQIAAIIQQADEETKSFFANLKM